MSKTSTKEVKKSLTEKEVKKLLTDLFPVARSLTGDGVRQTLECLSDVTQLNIGTIPSGASVYDWEVPPEWSIREAYIADSSGERIVDFADSNLHVVNYSVPVDAEFRLDELQKHLHTLPEMPDAIPYRTSYYERDWGFCLRHDTFEAMDEDETYQVYIDSDLDEDGELTYADARTEGRSDKEYIISTYCCHPSLANDNLSGLILATLLFDRLRERSTYHSYRLVVVPETIGAISYLNEHERQMKAVDGGYVITTVAGPGSFDYKESFEGDHPVDKAARWALTDDDYEEHAFTPCGSDERQYSTPGFRIPTGTIAKDKYFNYDAYHTSKDDLSFVSAESLLATLDRYLRAIDLLEKNRVYERVDPHCEFKLDKRGLHPTTGGQKKQPCCLEDENHDGFEYNIDGNATESGDVLKAIKWLMFGCDGETSLFELAERSDMDPRTVHRAARELVDANLLEETV